MKVDALTVEYDSAARRSPLLGELFELLKYRDLLLLLVLNITRTRYRRSALGVVWTLLNPLLNMAVLTVAFSTFFQSSLPDYPAYILAGLIFWNFFSQTTTAAMNTLVWGGSLIKRIYIPRGVFAAAAIGNGLINLALSLIPLVLIMFALRHPFYPTWWVLPFAVLLLAMFSMGAALFMSTLAAFFADVVEMYQVALQALFFLMPIMYPQEILPAHYQAYARLNPLYNLLEVFREPLYSGTIPSAPVLAAAAFSAVAALIVGWWVFTSKVDELAYRI